MMLVLVWFLVSQIVSGLPEMSPGTEVRLVSQDLLTIYASARVEEGRLAFSGTIEPDQEVRLLIFPPGVDPQRQGEVLEGASAFPGRVSSQGRDILVRFSDDGDSVSLYDWLGEERGILLVMPGP
ncbi:MAG: hypothetical protein JSV66_10120 [Trueperaceae bacterium]|nr:MAG: hypothetical protein JSV66_10120 [Trueperaceae bacterium]